MARTVAEIKADLEASSARHSDLMGELRQARIAEAKSRSATFFASLPADWRDRIITAAESAMLEAREDEFAQADADLGPAVSSFEVHVNIENMGGDDD